MITTNSNQLIICPAARSLVERATLSRGPHRNSPPTDIAEPCEGCLMELASQVEMLCKLAPDAHWGDDPETVGTTVTAFGITLNDHLLEDERQLLKPYALKVIGTKGDLALERKRAFMLADWACREVLPTLLRDRGHFRLANTLEELEPVVDQKTAYAAEKAAYASYAFYMFSNAADAVKGAAYASRSAASGAAYDCDSAARTAAAAVLCASDVVGDAGRHKYIDMALAMLDRLIEVTE